MRLAKAIRASQEETLALVHSEGGFSSCIVAAPRLHTGSIIDQVGSVGRGGVRLSA